ncbi:hypothetical protein LTR70_005057 [Exophiala xenobiotica]|uniref:Restriction of telomere capping protein 4 n=1 Tax=Lithohypha guttulata TaxID=1690604 RepID=A0ABR0K8U5_9EURO|nr:hypothetical protein LTR24_005533 [Lithohypha guttulata]KAK5319304.1 hypothetical protein LTR70_005057 [Exophiala xenobiotica]
MADVDDDVNRPPESSDDEAQIAVAKSLENPLPTPANTQSSQSKRPLENTDGNRRISKRRKTEKDATIPSTMPETKPLFGAPDEPDWLSQPSQASQKKRSQGYGSRATYKAPPVVDVKTPEKRGKEKSFVALDGTPPTPSSRRSNKDKKLSLLTQSPVKRSPSPARAFMIPDGIDDLDNHRDSTTNGSKESLFERAEKPRERRGSDSSLSSLDIGSEYQFDDNLKARLNAVDEDTLEQNEASKLDSERVICPVCKRTSLKSSANFTTSTLRVLPLSKQQKFCYDHRIQDAKGKWAENGYPDIDFDTLSSASTLQKHLKALPSIVQRKKISHYLTALDDAISAAKGNQTTIERYFNLTAITTIHNGYYGPRGAKIISQAISEDADVAKVLKKAIKSDKSFRLAGIGRAIDCVLLPEILVRLVMEDMSLGQGRGGRAGKAEEEARKVLEESVDVGLMLCGDDDHVDGREDDDVQDL